MKPVTPDRFATGKIIREPVAPGNGYWAGAPEVFHAPEEGALYLTYRIRRPRGVAPDRGGEARIARSIDFERFEDVWSVTKDRFASASIERCALRKGPDGQWRYFVSFVDPADGRWCVSVLQAPTVPGLDPAKVRRVFSAGPLGLEGVKDPWIFEWHGVFHLFLSVAVRTPKTRLESHSTLDIFNTGECVSATGLAMSRDLDHWEWQGVVFAPSDGGWDAYCRRLNCMVPGGRVFCAFYDGSASERENYEERTGMAESGDLRTWRTLTPVGPCLTSPHATGSVRYLDTVRLGDEHHLFYEFARADGAHDLRRLKVEAGDLVADLRRTA
ncbi:MAG: hypothetical protein KGS61_18450 [Verrucomicrobia bacterium]|nr:hypothetical protein [Verrucomicrobiota bacterium]